MVKTDAKKLYIISEGIISLVIIIFMTMFFSKIAGAGDAASDMSPHIRFAISLPRVFDVGLTKYIEETTFAIAYPGWHIAYCLVHLLISDELLACGALNAGLVVLNYLTISFILYKEIPDTRKRLCVPILALGIAFFGPLTLRVINENYYLGQFSYNLWHNPTTLAVKPLALFITYKYICLDRQKEEPQRENVSFFLIGLLLFISAFIKPSFIQVFVPSVTIYCMLLLTKGLKNGVVWGLKNACMVAPSALVILIQNLITQGQTGGVEVALFQTWDYWTKNRIGSFFLSFAYIILIVLVFSDKLESSTYLRFPLAMFLVGFLEYSLLSFTVGPWIGDLEWGFSLAIGPAVMGCVVALANSTISKKARCILWTVFGLHVLCGFVYWIKYFKEVTFWVKAFL